MQIKIADRYLPYSHQAGSRCLIPGSSICAETYPARLKLFDLSSVQPVPIADMPFSWTGPVRQFTTSQDLEKGYVDVWGHAREGYFHYRLQLSPEGAIDLSFKKSPANFFAQPTSFVIEKQASAKPIAKLPAFERLSFGISKAQEWPMMHRRLLLSEILPIWFRLAQWTPVSAVDAESLCSNNHGGAFSLLPQLSKLIADRDIEALPLAFRRLYCAGFEGMLSPCADDCQHQGFQLPPLSLEAPSPLLLLSEGGHLIRRVCIDVLESEVLVLPALLPELHAGRMLNVQLADYGCLDLEWSKKTIRRMIFTPTGDCCLSFRFHKGMRSCRLREGKALDLRYQSRETFEFRAARFYIFDNFQ